MANTFPSEGKAGIGTILPEQLLHIKADESSGGKSRIIIENSLGHKWFLNTFSTKNHFSIGRVGVADIAVDAKGNVGIGLDTAQEKLEVKGNVFVAGKIAVRDDDGVVFTLSARSLTELRNQVFSLESQVRFLEDRVRRLESQL